MKLSDLWSGEGTIDRGPYFFWGVALFALKFNVDRIIGAVWFGKPWTFFDPEVLRISLWQSAGTKEDVFYFLTLLAVSLPFLWVGIVLTFGRLRSLGWPSWLVLLFFVPVLKLLLFALLCLVPARAGRASAIAPTGLRSGFISRLMPRNALGSALVSIVITVSLAAAAAWLATSVANRYGWALFVGVPFVMGFLSTTLYGYHEPRTLGKCLLVALGTIVLAGSALLLLAMEGAICLIMAAPIALVIGLAGGAMGYAVQKSFWSHDGPARVYCVAILLVPALIGLERTVPPP